MLRRLFRRNALHSQGFLNSNLPIFSSRRSIQRCLLTGSEASQLILHLGVDSVNLFPDRHAFRVHWSREIPRLLGRVTVWDFSVISAIRTHWRVTALLLRQTLVFHRPPTKSSTTATTACFGCSCCLFHHLL